jgi:hypothetical protein
MVLNPVLVSLWTAAWAVLCATLPILLILHGMVAQRIARSEGWNAVLRRGRYLRALREEGSAARAMLLWMGIAFTEMLCLMAVSALTFATGQ